MRLLAVTTTFLLLSACGDDEGTGGGGGNTATSSSAGTPTSGTTSGPGQGGAGPATATATGTGGDGAHAGGADIGAGGTGGDGAGTPGAPTVELWRTGIEPEQLGVLVNDADPISVEVAAYYVAARAIPAANVVHLSLPSSTADAMSQAELAPLALQVEDALDGSDVQALAITWTKPYRVENMSVTSAFSLGFKAIGDTCIDLASQSGTPNPYDVDREATAPFDQLGFRPAMTIPGTTVEEAKAIIDRGIASDATWPEGSAYLMNTSDQTRSARCLVNSGFGWTNECQTLLDSWDTDGSGVGASIVVGDSVANTTDVLFYFQGLASVPDIFTNTYPPGAVADHLTSYGGQIPTSGQMSAFQFLLAGATGSFGTVVEPCAYQQKFPDPATLVPAYFRGATLIEAYWKSVRWPAEGIFIGEPLARPWGPGFRSRWDAETRTLTIEVTAFVPGVEYALEARDPDGSTHETQYSLISNDRYTRNTFVIENADHAVYYFREIPPE